MSLRGQLQLQRGDFRLDTGPFAFPAQGVTAVFGPSGCGKTTLLRALAGLEKGVSGELQFAGQRWLGPSTSCPPEQRRIGYVFQDAALFPHRDVRGNLEYAHRRCAPAHALGRDAVERFAAQVGIHALLDRSVQQLSGGESQRVAIARALLSGPQLLCLDEPLSALDWQARDSLLQLIDELAHTSALPVVYVTHTASEVERLASHVAFMHNGQIVRMASLSEALSDPHSALFEQAGPASVFDGKQEFAADAQEASFVSTAGLRVLLPRSPHEACHSERRRLRVMARDVAIAVQALSGVSIQNQLPVVIREIQPEHRGRVLLSLGCESGEGLYAEITARSAGRLQLTVGQSVYALVKSVALIR